MLKDQMIKAIDLNKEYHSIKEEINLAIQRVLDSGWYILGDEVEKFEEEFAQYIGAGYAVGVNSGTDALLISLMALDIKSGDEVLTVSHTTTPTVIPISILGATPVFIDIDPDTYTMDVSQVEKKISDRTKAIIPVHIYGNPVDMDPLIDIAKRHGIYIVEDACQAHGAEYKGRKVGTFGDMAAFSFYPTKNLGGYGDGGIVLTSNTDLYEKMLKLRQYGWKARYESQFIGINSRLDEMQAAILRTKLKYLDERNEKRIQLAHLYRELLQDSDAILPMVKKHSKHVFHLYVIRHKNRDKLKEYLLENGVQTKIHYPVPVHQQKAFLDLRINVSLPITEQINREILSLPIYPELSIKEVESIVRLLIKF
ncbi:DegT/DnrJ/EryC1/StrS family aminotransferase [Candidatus Omnitrophota bacterium]